MKILTLVAFSTALGFAQAQRTDWVGPPGTGNWFLPGNWTAGVPTAIETAFVGPGSVEIANGAAQALSLNLFPAAALAIRAGGSLQVSEFISTPGATLELTDGASLTPSSWFQLDGDLIVSGGSRVDLRSAGLGLVQLANTLVNQGGQIITGQVLMRWVPGTTLDVDGPGSVVNAGNSIVGAPSAVTIRNGGAVQSSSTVLANTIYAPQPASAPLALIDGQGSVWQAVSNFVIGGQPDEPVTLTVQNDGKVSTPLIELLNAAVSPASATLNVGTGGRAGVLDAATVSGGALSFVNFNHANDIAIATTFIGALNLIKRGAGILQMNGASSYSGPTGIEGGTLRAGAANAFSPNSAHTVSAGATLDLAGFNQTLPSLTNSGTVSTVGSAPGATLTVTGPYIGNNGVLRLGTRLGDSASATDRLVLDGPTASASGSTTVQITNLGGLGAATTGDGIEVISARNGATTTAQTTQNAFTLANGGAAVTKGAPALQATTAVGGHVDAGAYEYRLYAADANGAGENWYLRSTVPVAIGGPNVGGISIVGPQSVPAAPAPINVVAYRSEVPLYASVPAQLRRGGLAMLGNRRQRIGDDDLAPGAGSGGAPAATALGERRAWGRLISTKLDIRQGGTVSPASDGRLSGFQAGTDLFANRTWRAGIYVGRLEGDAGVSGFASGIANQAVGSTDLRSHYFGGYGTWTGDNGWYADAVLQAGRHRYRVQPHLGLATSAKGSSLTASIEVGKAFDLGSSGNWKVEPSVQLAHQRLSLDDSTISGAVVQNNTHNGWIARAGVRVKGEIATGAGLLQPYGRLNVYRTSSGNDVARFIGPAGATDIASAAGSNSTELAGGFTLALNERTSLYAEAGKLWSSGGGARVKSGVQGSVGLRIKW